MSGEDVFRIGTPEASVITKGDAPLHDCEIDSTPVDAILSCSACAVVRLVETALTVHVGVDSESVFMLLPPALVAVIV